jgi:cytochrome c-type biogenesis protein CcmH
MKRFRLLRLLACLNLLLVWSPLTHAVDNLPALADPVLRQRYYNLTHELRCMQCQNESLADSTVGLAADLREQVRELLLAGQSDDQIRDHMAARYGDFILFRPRMNWRNAWLWGAPVALMLIGGLIAWRVVRDRAQHVDDDPSDPNADSLNS